MKKSVQLTVLGPRGSMATGRKDCVLFGGDSSCYMVRAGDETVFLDAGSGLVTAPARYPKPPVILLSHLHLDHLIGLGMFPGFNEADQKARVYRPFCGDAGEAAARMARVYSPPFWPIELGQLKGEPELLPMPPVLRIGELLALTWDCIDISPEAIEEDRAYLIVNKEVQRVSKEAMKDLDHKDIIIVFPENKPTNKTVRVLKSPKTDSSIRKVYLPRSVARMLEKHRQDQEEMHFLVRSPSQTSAPCSYIA